MNANSTLDSKAVRAIAGAADVAATSLRDLSTRVVDAVSDERFRTDVRDRFNELSGRLSAAVADEKTRDDIRRKIGEFAGEARNTDVPGIVKNVPTKAAELQDRAREAFTWERRHELMTEIPARVRDAANQAAQRAARTYEDLASRGEGVVSRWRDEYRGSLGETVAALRGRVADAADDVADAADKVADDLGDHGPDGGRDNS